MKNLSPEKFLLLKQNASSKSIISSSVTYTFEELRKEVLNRASNFKSQNICSGENVGILSKNDSDFVIDIYALWQLSAVPVPINTRLNESDIEEQLTIADCNSLIVNDAFVEKVNSKNRRILNFNVNYIDKNFTGRDDLKLTDPAVIIFTSGSTSKSKGIILSFNSLFNSAINSNQLLRYTHSDRWLASLPFYHIGGFSIITRSLLLGIPLIVPDSLSMEHIIESQNKFRPTFISLVSAQLKKIVDEKIKPNQEMKNCLIGGGFSDLEVIRLAYDLGWPVNVVYGSTETSSFVTALLKDEIDFKQNSVGRAIPTNQIKIFDEDGNELKPFEIGEVAVQSSALMSGYLNDAETKQIIKNGFYYTGDIGYLDEDGYLFLEGRKNFVISTGGENINPSEVEKILLQHPLIQEAAVFPLRDQKWGEIISAVVVLKDKEAKISSDDIKTFLKERLTGYKIPKKIFFEDQLPKTELGKIEKDKLINRYRLTSL
jgi:O-succinylbenzoic acid--CoA ligase